MVCAYCPPSTVWRRSGRGDSFPLADVLAVGLQSTGRRPAVRELWPLGCRRATGENRREHVPGSLRSSQRQHKLQRRWMADGASFKRGQRRRRVLPCPLSRCELKSEAHPPTSRRWAVLNPPIARRAASPLQPSSPPSRPLITRGHRRTLRLRLVSTAVACRPQPLPSR